MHRRTWLNVEWCCKVVNALSSRRPLLSTLRHELVGNYETLSYAERRSRLPVNHSPTRLQSSRGQRNARPAALITRAYSQAGKFKDFGGSMGLKLHGVVGLNLKMIVTMWSGMCVVQHEPCHTLRDLTWLMVYSRWCSRGAKYSESRQLQ